MSKVADGCGTAKSLLESGGSTVKAPPLVRDDGDDSEGDFEIIGRYTDDLSSMIVVPDNEISYSCDLVEKSLANSTKIAKEKKETNGKDKFSDAGPQDYSILSDSTSAYLAGSFSSDDGALGAINAIKKEYEAALSLRGQERDLLVKTIDANVSEVKKLKQELKTMEEGRERLNHQLMEKESQLLALKLENQKLTTEVAQSESFVSVKNQDFSNEIYQKNEEIKKLFETIQQWKSMYEEEHEKLVKERDDQENNSEIIRVLHQQYFESEQMVESQRTQLKSFEDQVRGSYD